MGRLDGKVALITGGARGQGAAEAELFVGEGATVVITDVLNDVGEATAERLGSAVSYRELDVTQLHAWDKVNDEVIASHGRIDILVNNAGIFQIADIFSTTEDDWHTMLSINQTGVFFGMKTVGGRMRDQGSGSIINISSIAGLRGTAMAFAYGATKWAVRGMTKSVATQLAPNNVRVNSVHPGIIETPMLDEFGQALPDVKARIPMGRTAAASEVGELVLFLASDESSYCSGHEFVVDGAMTA